MAIMKPVIGAMEPFHTSSDTEIVQTEHYQNTNKTEWWSSRVHYIYPYKQRNENPAEIVNWCRRNFGERHVGWDFYFSRGNVIIEVWDSRFKTMYEMWKK